MFRLLVQLSDSHGIECAEPVWMAFKALRPSNPTSWLNQLKLKCREIQHDNTFCRQQKQIKELNELKSTSPDFEQDSFRQQRDKANLAALRRRTLTSASLNSFGDASLQKKQQNVESSSNSLLNRKRFSEAGAILPRNKANGVKDTQRLIK